MSEFINNNQERVNSLYNFCFQLIKGAKGTELIKQYQAAIDQLKPNDIVLVVHRLVEAKVPMEELKIGINKALNVFHKQIYSHSKAAVEDTHFLGIMMQENAELDTRLKEIRPLAKSINSIKDKEKLAEALSLLGTKIQALSEMDKHYQRKENIFFPYFENQFPEYKCLGVMWSIHDDIRRVQKQLLVELKSSSTDLKRINRLLGDLFFFTYAIISREEYLLFPVALNAVSEELWEEMNNQSHEIGFSFIETPQLAKKGNKLATKTSEMAAEKLDSDQLGDTILNFDTGLMTLKQAMLLLNHLPVDITMIDENDRVCFFSNPKDRFFPRSKAIIGRTVQNCHPPESVHVVDDLVKAFKSGEKDSESFWIQMKGRFILIQYFALRDEESTYKGCIEVSQDVSDIRKLDGEKRLMDES
ncbi:hypothetical protein BZG02_06545 [Labilibaculum filiforme]|uniref:Hemerythrin-like domain-containing protein n=1 Tax=Labilibaculum filiforme TaxID=1940526 RepID=A0A2N3I2D1_9BACT|nr:PAS domain-containing protein [Labilibaculum filiforme]PKQ64461.1 hypothetical protein BZG02_06545 [Labilibaculum filiforme]